MATHSNNYKNPNKINFTKNEKQNLAYAIAISALIVLILVMIVLMLRRKSENSTSSTDLAQLSENEKVEEISKASNLEKLYDMSEQERITYYCAEFFKLVDQGEYADAYEILYDEYKENYFPTESSFEVYMKTYFPGDFSLDYTNMERLGTVYVLWVDINDTLNGSTYGHNFSMNVVIQENDYDEFVLSFSKNSAVDSDEEV